MTQKWRKGSKSHTKQLRRRWRPEMEPLEERCLLDAGFRSIDGTGNNLLHPDWGSAGIALLRVAPARYADGIDDPVVGNPARPGARLVSNTVADQGSADIISDHLLSAMAYAWGQFVDHDLDLTGTNSAESLPIPIPQGDPFFDPQGTGTQTMPFDRSAHVDGTGTSTANPRQQPNVITAFLDGSLVYGSDGTTAAKLRTFSGGHLKVSVTSLGTFLPPNNITFFPTGPLPMANDAHQFPDNKMSAAGDVRANENIELTSLQTLFVREHNRIADALRADNPFLSDETLYQLARRQVGAEIQVITYREWLPALLGANALPVYTGYKPTVNPGIANEFSTALFRVGHSMLGDDVEFIGTDGVPVRDGIPLSEAFFNPTFIPERGISPILKYLASDPSSEIDSTVVNSVRNFLFGPPGAGGFDLAARNIQRGRDHGLANYNRTRVAYGLPAVTSFADITSNVSLQQRLQQLYGNVNNIDLWVGALAEDHVPGTSTGPLIRAGLIDQFTRLRDGDRFWYQLVYAPADQAVLENNRTLSDLIQLNSAADVIQDNVFFFRASISGEVFNDLDRDGRHDAGEPGLAGRTMVLVNVNDPANPEEVARATTDATGRYRFDVFDGLRTGNYQVRERLPAGWGLTSANPRNVNIPRGETFLDVDFGNVRVGSASALSTAAPDPAATSASPAPPPAAAASFLNGGGTPSLVSPSGSGGGSGIAPTGDPGVAWAWAVDWLFAGASGSPQTVNSSPSAARGEPLPAELLEILPADELAL